MNKLNIFVCENFSPEFKRVVENERFDDIIIKPYYCMCENKRKKVDTLNLLQESIDSGDKGLVFCSKHCDIVKLIPKDSRFEIKSKNYCISHFANEQFINYVLEKGGYIIGSGWLNNWREHIENAGFDKDTARLFYHDFCKELVFFDAGIDTKAEENLNELSQFLDLPYVIIPFKIESLTILLKSVVYEWRLHKNKQEHAKSISELKSQCADYSMILNLIGKISAYANKRDTIEKIKEIFIIIFGAQKFRYWEFDNKDIPVEVVNLFSNLEENYILLKEENKFCIKINHKNKVYGIIEASSFLFPQYIEKYLNFTIEISNVIGLVLSNIEQYEKLTKSEKELKYLSFHDSLTGLFNRTYINKIIDDINDFNYLTIFSFDIDRLKYVNDKFGHLEGDKLICSFSDVVKNCFRETDIFARIGGDEFIAILPECDTQLAEIINNRIKEAIMINNKNQKLEHLRISVSIGFAISENNEETIENIIQKADELMYVDKKSHRSK